MTETYFFTKGYDVIRRDKRLSANDYRVYEEYLALCCKKPYTYCSNRTLMRNCNIGSRSTLSRSAHALENMGFIWRFDRRRLCKSTLTVVLPPEVIYSKTPQTDANKFLKDLYEKDEGFKKETGTTTYAEFSQKNAWRDR